MRASGFMAQESFVRLSRRIARIEGRDPAHSLEEPPVRPAGDTIRSAALPFRVPALDRALAGGLRRAALHEIRADESRNAAAMTGFAAALLARLWAHDRPRPVLWIVESASVRETGFPYGAGLARFGLEPSHLLLVRASRPEEALWVFEEGLRCRGLAAVVTEIRGTPRLLDLTASRRLALRAREHGVMGLLLRLSDRQEPGAALTRWLVRPRPAGVDAEYPAGIGNPAWCLALERNRLGTTGVFEVEWNHEQRSFATPGAARAPHSLAGPALPADRSSSPPVGRSLVA
jgi:protein ImuA